MTQANKGRGRAIVRTATQRIFAALLIVISALLGWLGVQLALLGGSIYYVLAAAALLASGALLWTGKRRGAIIYAVFLAMTWAWAFWETSGDPWPMVARVAGPTVLGCWLLTPWAYNREPRPPASGDAIGRDRKVQIGAVIGIVLLLLTVAATMVSPSLLAQGGPATIASAPVEGDWAEWGHDKGGQRFSPLQQITPQNVSQLKKVWEFRTGFSGGSMRAQFEATPLKVGETLYFCTPHNDVIALDATSGKQRWRFAAKSDLTQISFLACRGVSYFRDSTAKAGDRCAERIITATVDARLIALDTATGKPCEDFGVKGFVDLKKGMGIPAPAYYYVTSAPAIVRGKVIFGGFVPDNQRMGSPSGVIRAFDARTGVFAWAFDLGRPEIHTEPGEGEGYTPDTPNSWAPISADEALGLVYLPTGNASSDWFGGQRRKFDDAFSSSVVALDAGTGALRWSFQTTHHDIWDYDVPSQPTLYDFPIDGKRVPALIQPTKRGEIFVLDRRTGKPLLPVDERPVPKSNVPGERSAPTQPFSPGMPSFAGPRLTESTMWGLTPLDQAWCRLEFKKSVYQGAMTPVALNQPTIIYPGYNGGSNWGSIAVDRDRDILVGNSMRIAIRTHLIPRAEADRRGLKPMDRAVHGDPGGLAPQAGTPYGVSITPFLSPMGVPCQQPPWGLMNAIDLKARKLKWSNAFGTARDAGPLGLRSRLPFTMGTPLAGGPIATKSGLTFIGASQDGYLHAFDTLTGKLLWSDRLPAGGQANPMTYMTSGGRQMVVIAAGGNSLVQSRMGDYVTAYALP